MDGYPLTPVVVPKMMPLSRADVEADLRFPFREPQLWGGRGMGIAHQRFYEEENVLGCRHR
jgi:hypothetical protein